MSDTGARVRRHLLQSRSTSESIMTKFPLKYRYS